MEKARYVEFLSNYLRDVSGSPSEDSPKFFKLQMMDMLLKDQELTEEVMGDLGLGVKKQRILSQREKRIMTLLEREERMPLRKVKQWMSSVPAKEVMEALETLMADGIIVGTRSKTRNTTFYTLGGQ